MERLLQSVLQRVLGFDRYLLWFSRFKIRTLRWDRNEADVLHFIEQMPADGVVLDIGANIGIMTVLIARRVSRGHVHAFEPIPDNFRALSTNVDHFGLANVSLHQLALGETRGELEMVMPEEQHVRMQGLSHAVDVKPEDSVTGVRYTVVQERLDDVAALQERPIAGIKIDVEDFEQFVFRGGRQLIERDRPLVYSELGSEENRTNCFRFFEELGYWVGVLTEGAVVPYDPVRHDKHNFFLCPAAAADGPV